MGNINIIVATTTNLVIGRNNTIPWILPKDLQFFKKTTNGYAVVMGRKCWESLPEEHRPLSNRKNIVVTRNKNYIADGAEIRTSLVDVIDEYDKHGEELFIIGGSQIYKEGFKYANRLLLTQIYEDIDGDTKLEGFIPDEWKLTEASKVENENNINFRFELYERKNNRRV